MLDPPLDEMVAAHLRGCWALAESDFIEAYKCVRLFECVRKYVP